MRSLKDKALILKATSLISKITKGPGCEDCGYLVIRKDLFQWDLSEFTEETGSKCLRHSLHGIKWMCPIITDLVPPKAELEKRTQCRQFTGLVVFASQGKRKSYIKTSSRLWAKQARYDQAALRRVSKPPRIVHSKDGR